MKSVEGLSSSHLRDDDTGAASRSKESRKMTSHVIVYTVLRGNSGAVKSSGKRATWPATAKGRKALKYRRSLSARRLLF